MEQNLKEFYLALGNVIGCAQRLNYDNDALIAKYGDTFAKYVKHMIEESSKTIAKMHRTHYIVKDL